MSGIEQAGLVVLAVIALMVIGRRGRSHRPRDGIRDRNEDEWWFANRKWKDRD